MTVDSCRGIAGGLKGVVNSVMGRVYESAVVVDASRDFLVGDL